MKKKIFAFMLSCACIASSSSASLDLSNHLPHSKGIKWCLSESPLELKRPYELTCGDAECLRALEMAKFRQEVSPYIAADSFENDSLRPPALKEPISSTESGMEQPSSDESKSSSTLVLPKLDSEFFAWAQESLEVSAKTAFAWMDTPRRYTFEVAGNWLIEKSRNSSSNSSEVVRSRDAEPVADPIRHQLVVEDYRPYDFSFSDELRMAKVTCQSYACKAFADAYEQIQDAKLMDLAIAESNRHCSPPRAEVEPQRIDEVVIRPFHPTNQGPAYFVRQIPIEYKIVSEERPGVKQAEVSNNSELNQLYGMDLKNVFGTNVLPIIDFNRMSISPRVLARTLVLYGHSKSNAIIENSVVEQLPKTSWLVESINEHGNDVLRQSIANGLRNLKFSLNQVQSLVESLEVAIAPRDGVHVANKESLNR